MTTTIVELTKEKIDLSLVALELLLISARADRNKVLLYGSSNEFRGLALARPKIKNSHLCNIAEIFRVSFDSLRVDDNAFDEQISHVVKKCGLQSLFYRSPDRACAHRAWRPAGYDWEGGGFIPGSRQKWREIYCELSPYKQMISATLIYLYKARLDTDFIINVPRSWSVYDAFLELDYAGVLTDWVKLFLLYSPWGTDSYYYNKIRALY